jgi:hypothetical protein
LPEKNSDEDDVVAFPRWVVMALPFTISRRFLIAGIILAVISLLCTLFPLLNYLGYEFSFCIALAMTPLSGILTILSVREARSGGGDEPAAAVRAFRQSVIGNMVLLIIPLMVMVVNAFFVKNCSLAQGFGFFLLLPVVTAWFGSALGFFCVAHYRFSRIMYILVVLITFGYALVLGYTTPAVFAYNVFFGYFPGLTYDEALSVSTTLIFFRVLTIGFGAVWTWMALLILHHTRPEDSVRTKGSRLLWALLETDRRGVTIGISVVLVLIGFYRCELGFETSDAYIQDRLGSRIETDHVTIYYSRSSIPDREIRWIAAEHEFRIHQILGALYLPSAPRIRSYIYPSAEEKLRLIGAGNTNIAKPWSGEIHITRGSLDATLKHELVHVLAAPFGMPVINASLSTGLVEGLAMAVDWKWGNRTVHEYAAIMQHFDVAPGINDLMQFSGFARQSSSISYVLAGSFCRFLIDRYGIRKMMLLYGGPSYEEVYGKSLETLIGDWKGFLRTIPVTDQDRDVVDVLFRRPPIFKKVCARVAAERDIAARKFFERKDYGAASKLYEESFLEGGSYEALSGFLWSELRRGHYKILIGALDNIIMASEHPAEFLPLFLPIGDAFWAEGKNTAAEHMYKRLILSDVADNLTEAAELHVRSMSDSTIWPLMLQYFFIDGSDTARAAQLDSIMVSAPDAWIPGYLAGRIALRLGNFERALHLLQGVKPGAGGRFIEAVRLQSIGVALFRLRRFRDARESFWTSLNQRDSRQAVNDVNDWVDRCEWMMNNN